MKKLDPIIGWREWAELPDLGVKEIKVKIDTGAKTSALHAEDVELFYHRGKEYIRFSLHPQQKSKRAKKARAEVIDYRLVRSSNGHSERRPVIQTAIHLGPYTWPIEVTLTNRYLMGFPMLIGREALKSRFIIDPAKSFLMKKRLK